MDCEFSRNFKKAKICFMKMVFLFLLLLIAVQILTHAQPSYVPFPESGAVWTIYHYEPNEPIGDNAQYMFAGDTLINELSYLNFLTRTNIWVLFTIMV